MQIVIPMSGFGERFRKKGYSLPKPLIKVDGRPIIEYIVNMFSQEDDFIFICNEDHLRNQSYDMNNVLSNLCPNYKILSIQPHNEGPVGAVLKVLDQLSMEEPTIVNYCDFTCDWNYDDFKSFIHKGNFDGVIPCYKGFHPHTLWSNYYAYVKEKKSIAIDIQEKEPFTNSPTDEFASSGTYYFKTGKLVKKYFQKCVDLSLLVNNEYYVSMTYKPMMQDDLKVGIFELNHFMQWGTPEDLNDYLYWSNSFRLLTNVTPRLVMDGITVVPMAGNGSRFLNEGYTLPKPLINVSSKPMAVQAINDLPQTDEYKFIIRSDNLEFQNLKRSLVDNYPNAQIISIDKATNGQATTCYIALEKDNLNSIVTIAPCDNGALYEEKKLSELLNDEEIDVVVWGIRGYPGAIRSPNMYGWIDLENDTNKIKGVSVKKPLKNVENDPIVIGSFTFKKNKYFIESYNRMIEDNGLINNEYYVDNVINYAIKQGLNCYFFEIDSYLCWGTPNDLKTFNYWQDCFSGWKFHDYSIAKDANFKK